MSSNKKVSLTVHLILQQYKNATTGTALQKGLSQVMKKQM